MDYFKVGEVEKILNVSHATVYRKLKSMKKQLKGLTKKKKKILYISTEAIEIIRNDIKIKTSKASNKKNYQETFHENSNDTIHMNEPVNNKYVESLEKELEKRDHIINKMLESQEKDRDRQTQERERTDTIIMKLTQDLEHTRKLITATDNNNNYYECKDKDQPEKTKHRANGTAVSIGEYIDRKLQEDKEKSNRLKSKIPLDPFQGKSKLFKLYIKIFKPELLRRQA